MKFILYFILFFFLFRFVVRFLLPLFQITRMTSHKLREMQREMNDMQQSGKNKSEPQRMRESRQGDYIDYEEVK